MLRRPVPDALRRRPLREALFALLAVGSTVPLWLVDRPPLQDLPQHLAAIRVWLDYGDPELRFAEYFELQPWRTQYLAYYAVGCLLAWPLGVSTAVKLLVGASLVALPYSMRALLRALGRDERVALLVLPLAWNAHLVLGFLNFVAALPLSLWGVALAARLRRAWCLRTAVLLGVVALLCFYTHVVPFALLVMGAGLLAVGDGWGPSARRLLPLVPSLVATALWTQYAPAGHSTLAAASGAEIARTPVPEALRELWMWLSDVLHGPEDDVALVLWGLLVVLGLALGAGPDPRDAPPSPDEALGASLTRRVGLLCPLCVAAYFVAPASHDWIWPIAARFPLLAALWLVPLLPAPRRVPGALWVVAAALVAVVHVRAVATAFVEVERHETGELDRALEVIPRGSRVAALVFDRGSRYVGFSPFLHAAGWVQAERGGAVMFSFADFPHSPFVFREHDRPPRVPPRWEWMPERVDPVRDLGWFEYVLVRGGPGRIAFERDVFEPVFRGPRWSVWRRRVAAEPTHGG